MDKPYSAWSQDGKYGKYFLNIPSIDELCAILTTKFKNQEDRIAYLEKENEKLKSEQFKDNEITRLMQENKKLKEDSWRGFPISKEQEQIINNWWKKHRKEKHNGKLCVGTIGGDLEYKFIPTSIGIFGTVKCNCGEEFTFMEP